MRRLTNGGESYPILIRPAGDLVTEPRKDVFELFHHTTTLHSWLINFPA
jgi:hypothetical protein